MCYLLGLTYKGLLKEKTADLQMVKLKLIKQNDNKVRKVNDFTTDLESPMNYSYMD